MTRLSNSIQSFEAQPDKIPPSKVLFVSECSSWGKAGLEAVTKKFRSVQPVFWSPGMPKPDLSPWHGDWIISFKADLILSHTTLKNARKGAINFHPCPPKYRGIGGYWWALQNQDASFGVTCHHMNEKIDHGEIIEVKNFPICSQETVESLKDKAAHHSLALLYEIIDMIVKHKPLQPCGAEWASHLYTYKELERAQNALSTLSTLRAVDTLSILETTQNQIVALNSANTDHSKSQQDPDKTAFLALG